MIKNRVVLGLGSNLGNREKNIETARKLIFQDFLLNETVWISEEIESAPWGNKDQPAFINQVIAGYTEWNATAILQYIQNIENQIGRNRQTHWGPRFLDIDILLFNQDIINLPQLTLPHPYISKRDFVLFALKEWWPDEILPGSHSSFQTLWNTLIQEQQGQFFKIKSMNDI